MHLEMFKFAEFPATSGKLTSHAPSTWLIARALHTASAFGSAG